MMSKRLWTMFCKILTLLGGFLLCAPDGGLWSWGNISVYVLSYMRMVRTSGSALESPWLLSLFIIGETIGLMVADVMSRVLGRRLTTVLGILSIDGGLFLSYYTVQKSMAGFNITSGFLTGLGFGLIFSIVLLYVIDWAENSNEGLFIAIISTAMTVGGSMSIEVVSRYANPENETPDLHHGPTKFFTQTDVLTRVPNIYFVIGGLSLFLHITGFAMLRDKPIKEQETQVKEVSVDENTCLQNGYQVAKYKEENGFFNSIDERDKSKLALKDEDTDAQVEPPMGKASEGNRSLGIIDGNDSMERKNGYSKATGEFQEHDSHISPQTSKPNFEKCAQKTKILDNEARQKTMVDLQKRIGDNYLPSEMLRDKTFYVLSLVLICNDFGYVTFANYYKLFGQLFINNDHSLADVGTALTISVASTRVAWGIMIDKLGVKWVLIIFTASFSWLFCMYYFTSLVAPWYYYVCTVVLACVDSGLHANFAVATLKYFGAKHFTFNMGILMSSTVLLNLVAPPLLRLLLHRWGWFVLFITNGIVNFMSLILVCYGLPTV